MISGELETNGDHWRTLAASLVRLSLSHHDQTSEVRRGQEGPMSPSDPTSVSLSARTHLASGHTCNRTIFLFTRNQPSNICLFRIPESALDSYNSADLDFRDLRRLDIILPWPCLGARRLPTLLLLNAQDLLDKVGVIGITCPFLTTFIRDKTSAAEFCVSCLHPCPCLGMRMSVIIKWLISGLLNVAIRPPKCDQGWKLIIWTFS